MKDDIVLDLVLRLWKSAVGAEDIRFDVAMNQSLQGNVGMSAIDHSSIRVRGIRCLRSKLAPKELVDFGWISMKGEANVVNVGNHGLDSVSTAFNLSEDGRHPIAVFRVIDRRFTADVDNCSTANSHFVLSSTALVVSREWWKVRPDSSTAN